MLATIQPSTIPEQPYRGIESFRFVDQRIFFARKEETRKLLRHITIYRGVLLYGDSGTGKSSLINAGFIPAALADEFAPERVRVQPRPGQEIIVERIAVNGDGKAPYLPSIFDEGESSLRIVLSTTALKEKLKKASEDRTPLLIFDQFEEFITLFGEGQLGGTIQDAQVAQNNVFNTLVELLRDESLQVKLLFVFREDYLAKLTKLFMLYPNLPDQYLRLTAPRAEALGEIIQGPFKEFPDHFGAGFSDDLVKDLSNAIKQRNEAGAINLSEVQIACLELWESAESARALFYKEGVQGLLDDYLSDSLGKLNPELREPAVALLSRMITSAGTRNVISGEDLLSRVRDKENIDQKLLEDALRALEEDTKLVRRERRHDTHFYEIVSEFLVPWIRRKKIERDADIERRKLEEDAKVERQKLEEAERLKRQKLEEAEQLKRQELEEAERGKRRRAFTWASIILVIGLAVGIYAWQLIKQRTKEAIATSEVKAAQALQEKAEEEKNTALSEKAQLEIEKNGVLHQKTEAEKQRDEFFNQKNRLEQQQAEIVRQKTAAESAMAALQAQVAQTGNTKDIRYSELLERSLDLERAVKKAQSDKAQAEKEKEAVVAQKDRAEREKEQLRREAKDLTTTVSRLMAQVRGVTREPVTLDETISLLTQRLNEAERERQRLEKLVSNRTELLKFQDWKNLLDELPELQKAIIEMKEALTRKSN